MRKPGIVSLHAGTTTNALHYAWQHCSNDETRRFLLLQNAAFLTLFRARAGAESGIMIDEFEPAANAPTLDQVFADVSGDKLEARQEVAGLAEQGRGGEAIHRSGATLHLPEGDGLA